MRLHSDLSEQQRREHLTETCEGWIRTKIIDRLVNSVSGMSRSCGRTNFGSRWILMKRTHWPPIPSKLVLTWGIPILNDWNSKQCLQLSPPMRCTDCEISDAVRRQMRFYASSPTTSVIEDMEEKCCGNYVFLGRGINGSLSTVLRYISVRKSNRNGSS